MNNYLKLILVLLSCFLFGCSNTIRTTCPDGQIVFVQKNPEKQYKQYVKSSENKIKTTIDILDKIKLGDLDVSTKRQVTLLRQQLDQFSARNEDVLKSSFLYVNTKPCDTAGQREHNRLLKEMNSSSAEVEKLRLQLEDSKNSESKIKSVLEEYFSKNAVKTCNRNPTDNFYFFLVPDSNQIKSFTLQINDVMQMDSLEKMIKGFLEYTNFDKAKFQKSLHIIKLIDEKTIPLNSTSNALLANCNNGVFVIPEPVLKKYETEHVAFVLLKMNLR